MGGITSKAPVEAENTDQYHPEDLSNYDEESGYAISNEKIKLYQDENIMPQNVNSDHIQLRNFLDDNMACYILRKQGKKGQEMLFDCWTDMMTFKNRGKFQYAHRHAEGLHLYNKYVTALSIHCVDDVVLASLGEEAALRMEQEEALCRNHFTNSKCSSSCEFSLTGFDWVLSKVFIVIFEQIYMPICQGTVPVVVPRGSNLQFAAGSSKLGAPSAQSSGRYHSNDIKKIRAATMLKSVLHTVKDYAFEKVLGEGTFGMVVLCKKISTGKKYAMKIQEKDEIIKYHADDTSNVCAESVILASCDHPYIVKLYYALQTNKLAALVLSYCQLGDLSEIMNSCGLEVLPLSRVQFYMAELADALGYLHAKGIIHRDVKPSNVLLCEDGHIVLTDFGSAFDGSTEVWDVAGEPSKACDVSASGSGSNGILNSFGSWGHSHKRSPSGRVYGKSLSGSSKGKHRSSNKAAKVKDAKYMVSANAIVGTDGYLSPEIAYIHALPNYQKNTVLSYYNYTKAVDWWSFGATVHMLLTATRPVSDAQMKAILLEYKFTGGVFEYPNVLKAVGANSQYSLNSSFSGSNNANSESRSTYDNVAGVPPAGSNSGRLNGASYAATSQLHDDTVQNGSGLDQYPELMKPQPVTIECSPQHASVQTEVYLSFIGTLLDVNFITRLGTGQYGTYNVKAHKFFANINWRLIEKKALEPPSVVELFEKQVPRSTLDQLKSFIMGRGSNPDAAAAAVAAAVANGGGAVVGSKRVGKAWSKQLRSYLTASSEGKNNDDSTELTSEAPGQEFNLNFEKLLISVGREHWLLTPLQLINSSISWGNMYSAAERKSFFNDWNYVSYDVILDEVGL